MVRHEHGREARPRAPRNFVLAIIEAKISSHLSGNKSVDQTEWVFTWKMPGL